METKELPGGDFDPKYIIWIKNYLMIPVERWYGTTELQKIELPDNDFGQDKSRSETYPDNDFGWRQSPIRKIPDKQNYLIMVLVQDKFRSKTDPDNDSGPRQIPIQKIPDR